MVTVAIHYNGECTEALKLYQEAFDATVDSIRYYDDEPEQADHAGKAGKRVLHSGLMICGTLMNFSDSEEQVQRGDMLCLNVSMPDAQAVEHAYRVLKRDGQVAVELGPQFFSPMYAAVLDRYGVRWQIMC